MSSGFNGSGCTCVSASTFLPNHSGYFSAATDPDTGEEKVRYVLNRRETLLAREKQAQIKMGWLSGYWHWDRAA